MPFRRGAGAGAPRSPRRFLDTRRPRYHRRDASPHVTNAILHLGLARRSARAREAEHARTQYLRCVESWQRANEADGGRWSAEVAEARRELAAFVAFLGEGWPGAASDP
ncbi:MAG: hypothetical protein ACYDA8_15020 [Deferrisomatales bacterium]